MSFLRGLTPATFGTAMNGLAAAGGATPGYTAQPAAAPSMPANTATKFGTAMNGLAAAGGATPGYTAQPVGQPQGQGINNHLQLLDPAVLQAIMQQIRGGQPQGGGAYR